MISETIRVETESLLLVVSNIYRLGTKENKQRFKMVNPDGDKIVAEADLGETQEQILDQVFQFKIQGISNQGEVQIADMKMELNELHLIATTIGKILQSNGIYVR